MPYHQNNSADSTFIFEWTLKGNHEDQKSMLVGKGAELVAHLEQMYTE